jgi:hypothetical protein
MRTYGIIHTYFVNNVQDKYNKTIESVCKFTKLQKYIAIYEM